MILLSPLIMLGNAALSYAVFKQFGKFLPLHVLLNIYAFAFLGIFGFMASSNIYMTMKLVFKSPYFESLIPYPVSGRTLFFVKLSEIFCRNYLDLFFILPTMFALAYVFNAGFLGILALFFVFILFELFISSLVLSFIMIAVRYFSRKTAENIVWCFNVFFILFFIILQNLPSSYLHNNTGIKGLSGIIRIFSNQAFEFLPTKWPLWFLYYISKSDFYHGAVYLLLIILLLALTLKIALNLFENGYITGWQRQNECDCAEPAKAAVKNINFSSHLQIIALIQREIKLLLRTREIFLSFFIMPAVFVFFNLFSISFGGMNPFSFLIFTIYICILSSTVYCFGLEGAGIYFLKSLPVPINKIFWAKYSVYALLNIIIAFLCALFSYHTSNFPAGLKIKDIIAPMVISEIWLNLIVMDFGFLFANFKNNGKLKESISITGTISLTVYLIFFFGSLAWTFYEGQSVLFYSIMILMFLTEYFVHFQAVKRYVRGEE